MSEIEGLIDGLSGLDAIEKLQDFMADPTHSKEERDAAFTIANEISDGILKQALGDFQKGTAHFLELIAALETVIASARPADRTLFDDLLDRTRDVFQKYHAKLSLKSAWDTVADANAALQAPDDESEAPVNTVPSIPAASPDVPLIEEQPTPSASTHYAEIAEEYVRYFFGSQIRSSKLSSVRKCADTVLKYRSQYEAVGNDLGIPWWFVAGVHLLESGCNFKAHLHNGDPLSSRTTHVPKGRPASGTPPFTWTQSATDALTLKSLDNLDDWSLSRALYRWERYNGFGYRNRGVPTPYLWSYSSVYGKGKYVKDGVFDKNAVSKQCGAAVLLRYFYETGVVALYDDENEQSLSPEFGSEVKDAEAGNIPPVAIGEPLSAFETFFRDNVQNAHGVQHFQAREFLVKGNSNSSGSCAGLNTDPPEALWPNMIELATVLEEFRKRIAHPVRLLSVYRSPAYNACIGGAGASQHMKFCAADLAVIGSGTGPREWARILHAMRTNEGIFSGGIGLYPGFVHVDTRGMNADW